MSDWSKPDHVTESEFNMTAKSPLVCLSFIPGERRKTGALLGGICLNGLVLAVFSFSSYSCVIRLLQCLRFGLPDETLNSFKLKGYVSGKNIKAK